MSIPTHNQIIRTTYIQLDPAGRHALQGVVRAKTDVYLAGFLVVGFTSLLMLSLFLSRNEIGTLLATILGLLLTGWLWRRFWVFQSALMWMKAIDEGEL